MYSGDYIRKMNDEKTREAREASLESYIAKTDMDEGVRGCPFLAYYLPEGYEVVDTYFVDSNGFGSEGEPALTFNQFLRKVKKGYGYAIKESGQFQVYINEYRKI